MNTALSILVILSFFTALALAGTANLGLATAKGSTNPLYGVPWGVFTTSKNPSWLVNVNAPMAHYMSMKDPVKRALLKKVVLTPQVKWTGGWVKTHDSGTRAGIRGDIRQYIDDVTGGDHDKGVQVVVFRLKPYEWDAFRTLPTAAEVQDYKNWIKEFAAGVGNARMMIVLQPDIWFVTCQPGRSTIFKRLLKWTTTVLAKLPYATVYIDGSASDWLPANDAAALLIEIGVKNVRGFALGQTHYASDADEYRYGVEVIKQLKKRRVPGKHFVVNRQGNGRAFRAYERKKTFHKELVCNSKSETQCVALGKGPYIPFSGPCDGYLWTGTFQGQHPITVDKLLKEIMNSPYLNTFPPSTPYCTDAAAAPNLRGGNKPKVTKTTTTFNTGCGM